MNELVTIITAIIAATGGGYFGALFSKGKYLQEVELLKVQVHQNKEAAENSSIDNDIKLSAHYKEILDDLKSRYESRYQEFSDMMNRKISLIEEENKLKDRKIKLQQQEIVELKRENRTLKRLNANNSST